ncbi:hypothetical protein EYM_00625 [Ignicoccus islandicus DSM 13165]|uniref:Uncharacterized protein n=1 Tax=Ignicoccus islandicus DSM 13165 TaxID=940295 RepID=A0A0U3E9Z2_9CREN|nr:hypothetical protein [Ignicoccus islandicus]ALU12126.1 hypothetical protein EYM_00625 [Ignicoccus islandicus DSM 13165]
MPKESIIKRIKVKDSVVVAGTVHGDGMIFSIEGELLKTVRVGSIITTVSIGKKYLFGGRNVVVTFNGQMEIRKFNGIALGSHEDSLVVFYEGNNVSRVVNLRESYCFRVNDLLKGITEVNGLLVLGGKRGVYLQEKCKRMQTIPIEEVVGVASLDNYVYVLARDPFFVGVSYLHKFELTSKREMRHVGRAELDGMAYDLSANDGLLAASTNQKTYVFTDNLKKVAEFEGSISSGISKGKLCLTNGKALKCYELNGLLKS